ncbi:GTP-binding protein [Acholeplasma morum]|uniref:ribosome biogenesis GTP-binding protein YihA/YsxC n=1 Tax=Paracholeplasma morum TaxID=264637 RepID=UPI00195A4BA0|nr:ribosome biogenesis GTP-binding protein YihA/YsxC [Paracholeplasma morum]MBM7453296.1 GTP-binding protein [Paracholeplasma morum]
MLTIKSAEFIKSGTDETHYPDPLKTEYLLLGRSNVGKSSLINALLNRKNLARTSREPGKTVTLNFFLVNEAFYIVDAPGYGYARRSRTIIESFQKMITRYIQKRSSLKRIFLLVDMKVGATVDDVEMFKYLQRFGFEVVVILTKIDKCNQSEKAKNLLKIKQDLENAEILMIQTSSETKRGIDKILELFEEDLNE